MDSVDLSTLIAPLYLLLIAAEILLIRNGAVTGRYRRRDTATNLALGVGMIIADVAVGGLNLAAVQAVFAYRLATIPFTPVTWIVCFILADFVFYWSHRLGHRVRWAWASHVVHHSSQTYNLSTAVRQTWTGAFTGLVVLWFPLTWVGFQPEMIATVLSINLIYQFWIHTESIRRFPRWFEWIFNTPSHHRVHHGANARYLDANYAGTLIIWDRLLGSFVPEQETEPVRYGLVHNIESANPVRLAFHEYIDILADIRRPGLSLAQRLAYVFAPPGWSHDGTRMSSEAVKAAFIAAHPESAGEPGLPRELLSCGTHAASPSVA